MTRPSAAVVGPALVATLALVGLAVAGWSPAPLIAVPGTILVLWLPGYVLSKALVPGALPVADRLVSAILGSLGIVILVGLGLNVAGVKLGALAWLAALGAIMVAISLVRMLWTGGVRRGSRALAAPAPAGSSPAHPAGLPAPRPADVVLLAVAAVVFIAAVGIARLGVAAQPHEDFTQLWALPAENGMVRIGLRNREPQATAYRLLLEGPGGGTTEWNDIFLDPGETWERVVAQPAGQGAASLQLFLGDSTTPYRRIDLPAPEPSGP